MTPRFKRIVEAGFWFAAGSSPIWFSSNFIITRRQGYKLGARS
jgi:hypothetical protein